MYDIFIYKSFQFDNMKNKPNYKTAEIRVFKKNICYPSINDEGIFEIISNLLFFYKLFIFYYSF